MKLMISKNCILCNKMFDVNTNNKRQDKRVYCGRSCAVKSNRKFRKPNTDETNKKLSFMFSGKGNPFFGKKHSVSSLSKMSESSKWEESDYNNIKLSEIEQQVLDGLLLSDGCMSETSRISSRLTFGFKFRETCEDIFKALPSVNFSPIWENKGKYIAYHSKSNYYSNFLDEHKRWYVNGVKIIPNDLVLTPTVCYWWFIGDGSVNAPNLYLATNCFSLDDLNLVIKKFNEIGFFPKIIQDNKLIFHKKCAIEFMKWIAKGISIAPQYQYKWDNFYKNLKGVIE